MGIVRRTPCFRYARPDGFAAPLRGEAYFRAVQWFMRLRRPLGGHGRVRIGTAVVEAGGPCPDEVLYIYMPGDPQVAAYLQSRHRRGHLTIVDVTADVFGDLAPTEALVRAGAAGNTPEAIDYWQHPDTLQALQTSLTAAHVVTTSWAELVEPLKRRAGHDNVVHLPDLQDGRIVEFGQRFRAVLARADDPVGR